MRSRTEVRCESIVQVGKLDGQQFGTRGVSSRVVGWMKGFS